MNEVAHVLATANGPKAERDAARRAFLAKRADIWQRIHQGDFPASWVSGQKKFVGALRRTAIRWDLLLPNKLALGAKYGPDRIADMAQRDLLFHVLR